MITVVRKLSTVLMQAAFQEAENLVLGDERIELALVFGGLLNLSSHADSYPFDQELLLLHELILAYVNR